MAYRQAITERVKFLIHLLISKGFATNQEDLGKKMGVESKSYLSQLVNSKQNNTEFLNKLSILIPDFNKEWLYNEAIDEPFLKVSAEFSTIETPPTQEDKIKDLEHTIELLKKDVRYYADIADTRLKTIEVQTKLITALEGK